MAELIPLEYRIAVAQRALVRRWCFVLGATAVVAAFSFGWVYNWQRQQLAEYNRVNQECNTKSVKKLGARQLIDRRAELARKMATVQSLSQDELLLSLMRNISSQFSDNEVLDYLAVQAHGRPGADKGNEKFFARITGETVNDGTRADLVDRLTKAGQQGIPAMGVSAENTTVAKIMDGEAVRFQISCDEPARVADAAGKSAGKAP
jgi:hypothetical protein